MPLLDLGEQPLAGHFPTAEEAAAGLASWPLRLMVCRSCWLAQLDDAAADEPAGTDALVEPVSSAIRDHLDAWADAIAARVGRKGADRVVELASHGGSLHRGLAERDIRSTLLDADARRVGRLRRWGVPAHRLPSGPGAAGRLAERIGRPRLIVDQYLLAHVRRPVALLAALRALAGADTELVLECEYVASVLTAGRFDSLRHGHFSYFSLASLEAALQTAGWRALDVQRQPVFGGALRVWAEPAEAARDTRGGRRPVAEGSGLVQLRIQEAEMRLRTEAPYRAFVERAEATGRALVEALQAERAAGRRVAAYGAPTRGNTLLNSCGVGTDLVEFTVDANPRKQGLFLPGSGIPILPVEELERRSPDTILALTWDLAGEDIPRLPATPERRLRVMVPLPELRTIELPGPAADTGCMP